MCHDERFLNLWIRDLPFLLDYITSLPRYVFKSHYQTTFDDKSGDDHILYPQRVLPLWDCNGQGGTSVIKRYHLVGKPVLTSITPSAYQQLITFTSWVFPVVNTLMIATLPSWLCVQIFRSRVDGPILLWPRLLPSLFALSLGPSATSIGLSKSVAIPQTRIRFLGLLSDSLLQAFIIPEDKNAKFATLCEFILQSRSVYQVYQDTPVFCRQDNFFLPCCSCRTVIRQRNILRHFPSSSLFSPY